MKILGITGGMHSCGLAYLEDGQPIFAFEEERFNRIRTYKDFHQSFFRFPNNCGKNTVKFKEFNWEEIDFIASFFPIKQTDQIWRGTGLGPLPEEKYIKINHHLGHCALAYYCSGFKEDTFVISIDASGEKYSCRVYVGIEGDLKEISNISLEYKSLGHYYAMLTEFLGFKRLKDEGKVVGRASHGVYNEKIYNIFNKCITIEGLRTDRDTSNKLLGGVYEEFYNLWLKEFGSEYWGHLTDDIAFNGQLVFEEKILQLINNMHLTYPTVKNIAAAGGVFANVKLNKRINDLSWVKEVFIAPPMGDEGLPLGTALAAHKLKNPSFKPFKLDNAFLGTSYTDDEFEVDEEKYNIRPYSPNQIAYELKEGKVVGWFQGRYEHGPRALCNRSIIADPSIPGTYKKINDRLQRNDFMPFAPVVIDEYADKVFNVNKSKYTAEFMTMLYDTREEWINKIPAVVHPIDKTARIQIVTENSNPKFYNLINKFNKITNIPVLLNTSFNIHGEPIVCHPKEAFVHLDNNIVDILVINDKIYFKK